MLGMIQRVVVPPGRKLTLVLDLERKWDLGPDLLLAPLL
uniref:Uncharacterized protein n=1 Tax=Picea glauca TaxID=3330 RepID=A0A101M0K7_PICGL|nr:hypothetical protein ABT39_MTgene4126 [Picea glauca]QHR86005.1 hypothetical protein Q903MT_gene3 [Picea sitchensis]